MNTDISFHEPLALLHTCSPKHQNRKWDFPTGLVNSWLIGMYNGEWIEILRATICHFNSKTHMIWHSNHTWPLFLEGSPGSPGSKRSSWVPAHCFMVKPKIMITTISGDSSHNWHTIPLYHCDYLWIWFTPNRNQQDYIEQLTPKYLHKMLSRCHTLSSFVQKIPRISGSTLW